MQAQQHTLTPPPGAETVGARVAHWARRMPEALAYIDSERRVTFAQLDAEASAIARRIIGVDAKRRGNVCLYFEDKLAAIRSIVGVARSGHAYVPLDAKDPDERLRFILQDCEPIALLTEPQLAARARAFAPPGCIVIDISDVQAGNATSPLPVVDPDSTAYLYYTSGSTGQPKGVSQSHTNLAFFVDSYARVTGIGSGDRISMLYSLSFAAGIGGIYRGLALGITLCAYDIRRDGIENLADWLDREKITVLHTFAMVFREVAGQLDPQRVLSNLRLVHLGGESVFAGDIALFCAHTPRDCLLAHTLSATECAIIAHTVVGHDAVVPPGGVLPVGRPIPGVRIEIRREDGTAAADDEVGEIVVCSRHVSPGYWKRPELDAAAFSADPLEAGGRRYRTGDSGRIDAQGNLHFLGRKGSRFKVRGHTIDVAEIESALAACPDVAHCAVGAEADGSQPDSMRLIAYLESRTGATRDPAAIRRWLAARLPMHMLPASILYVDALPRTPGGKLDRKRLPQAATLPVEVRRVTAPRDAIEAAVAHVFMQLLRVDAVGPDDDFFLLGGDSLMGGELQARLKDAFGVLVANFHKDATVAGIAAAIRLERASATPASRTIPVIVALRETGTQPPLFMVHGRHGQAFVSPHFMQLLGDDQPAWAFQARGLDGLSEPHASVEAMADEYLAELRKRRPHGPYFLGALCAGVFIVTVMAQKLREAGETVLPLLLLDPPNSVFERGYSQMTEQQFATKMKSRGGGGRPAELLEDPAYMKSLLRTALAFERATAMHRPRPYDGDVYMLSSAQRVQGADAHIRQMFTGRLQRYEVAPTHKNALSPGNPLFARALADSLTQIREAALVTQ